MSANLNQRLFSAADSLRSKMDASEYKNYLLGLVFYKYLSDKLLQINYRQNFLTPINIIIPHNAPTRSSNTSETWPERPLTNN